MRWLALVAILGGCDVIFRIDRLPEVPDAPPIVGRWSAVEAGYAATCALDDDQKLWCWGSNVNGELGLASSLEESDTVQQVGDASWSTLAMGYATTCGIQSDGTAWCWGFNLTGQVGDGTRTLAREPKQVGTRLWHDISTNVFHTCGIREPERTLWCWGSNDVGQLGIGTVSQTPAVEPVAVIADGTWEQLSAGFAATCAIATDQSLWCWGLNTSGELGIGTVTPETAVVRVGTEQWLQVSAGVGYACGITAAHRLRCWGGNARGELGDGTLMFRVSPTAVLIDGEDRTDWIEVAASDEHTCALTQDGALWCWGSSTRGNIGLDGTYATNQPRRIEGSQPWLALGTGDAHTCTIARDHTMQCFGADGYGQLGDGGTSTSVPTKVADNIIAVDGGGAHTCAIDGDKAAFCTGINTEGALGTGNRDSHAGFVKALGAGWTSIAAGQSYSCGVSAGMVSCWGLNSRGQLGSPGGGSSTSPKPVRAGRVVDAYDHTCTIDNVTGFCWGTNDVGQVGNAQSGMNVTSPAVVALITLDQVATGLNHSCAITPTTYQVYCWGANGSGQLGTGNTMASTSPVALSPAATARTITAGEAHSCFVQGDGAAACWGNNQFGQLGVADNTMRTRATTVVGTWAMLSAGRDHTCGIRTDSTLWCWGRNHRGQLGDTTRSDRNTPVQVGMEADWAVVAAGADHTCATKKSDSSLWCWGDNDFGQLGMTAWRTLPVQVP